MPIADVSSLALPHCYVEFGMDEAVRATLTDG